MLLWPCQVGDFPMAEIEQVAGSQSASRFVVGTDRGECMVRSGTVKQNDGYVRGSQLCLLLAAQRGHGIHQNAVDVLVEQGADVSHLFVRIEIAIAKDQVAVAGTRGIFCAAGHLGKERIANVAEDESEGSRAHGHQAAGYPIWAIVQASRDRGDVLASLLVNTIAVVEGS